MNWRALWKYRKAIGIASAVLTVWVFLMFQPQILNDRNPAQAPAAQSRQASAGQPPSLTMCEQASRSIAEALSVAGGTMNNPSPGVLVMPASGWAMSSAANREGVVVLMAVQKACNQNTNVDYVQVEIRSAADNSLIGSGTRWNFRER